MLDFDLIKNILIIGMASSIITTMFVQRIKETIDFKKSNYLVIVSFVVSKILAHKINKIDMVSSLKGNE